MRTYDIILADPPWPYNARNHTGTKFGQGVHGHYETLSWAELEKFPIWGFKHPGTLLFLWATGPHLAHQIELAETFWGFTYVTVAFVWHKKNPKGLSTFAGPGNYTASNAEFVLLFKFGKPPQPVQKLVPSMIHSPRLRHSAKPPEIHERIEKMYPPEQFSHIELFARMRRPGWDAMGYEVTGELWKP